METKIASFNLFEIEIPTYMVDSTPQTGSCDSAITEWLEEDYIQTQLTEIGNDKIASELYEFGAWDDDELKNFEENKARILWIAIGNIWDEDYIN